MGYQLALRVPAFIPCSGLFLVMRSGFRVPGSEVKGPY